jgi:hypothetical protein
MDGRFVKSMPDLDQSNRFSFTQITDSKMRFGGFEFADLDGFRVDTYSL